MDQAEITVAVRRGLNEFSPVRVNDTIIENVTLRGVVQLGKFFQKINPAAFVGRKAITSNNNIFIIPSNCVSVLNVWDLSGSALILTDATNATPIVCTSASHGKADNDILTISDVGGNTAANGTWKIDNVTTNTFELVGSVGNAAYTSGGVAFLERYLDLIERIPGERTSNTDRYKYQIRGDMIVIDSTAFSNDIVVEYAKRGAALSDIPAEYHESLISFVINNLMVIPPQTDPGFTNAQSILQYNQSVWNSAENDILSTYKPNGEILPLSGQFNWEAYL